MSDNESTIEYKNEIIRKLIHLNSLSIPVIYFYISKELALTILIPITLAFFVVDIIRFYHPVISNIFYKYFGFLLRKREKDDKRKRLNGATNLLISAVFCVLIFPKMIVVTAFSVLIISDSVSALIGRKFGKTKFLRKSFQGTFAFFISALLVILLTPKIEYLFAEYLIATVAVFFGAIVENISIELDDNITIPVSIGLIMWILYIIFLPNISLYKIL